MILLGERIAAAFGHSHKVLLGFRNLTTDDDSKSGEVKFEVVPTVVHPKFPSQRFGAWFIDDDTIEGDASWILLPAFAVLRKGAYISIRENCPYVRRICHNDEIPSRQCHSRIAVGPFCLSHQHSIDGIDDVTLSPSNY